MNNTIVIADIRDGNIQRVTRHTATTPRGIARLCGTNKRAYMTAEIAQKLGATEIFIGRAEFNTTHVQLEVRLVTQRTLDAM